MTVLQVADLRFGYAGDTLFESVTFSLALGERAALVAPNGAGKSTLLRLIGKEIEPDAGTAVIKRRRLSATTGSRTRSRPKATSSRPSCPAFSDIVEALARRS